MPLGEVVLLDLKSKLPFALKVGFWAILFYFCLAFLVPKWQSLELTRRVTALPADWLLAAGLVLIIHYFYIFALWALLLRRLGSRFQIRPLFRAYVLALLAKYLPGKVVAHGVRARLALQMGLPGPAVSSSLIWEALFVLGSASVFGLLGYFGPTLAPLHQAARWLILVFGLGGTGLLAIGASGVVGRRWTRWIGLPQLIGQPLWLVALFLLYGASWLTYGLSHWLLANAITPLPPSAFLPLAVALAVSWGVGFVSIIAPAGLGIREGVLYLFIAGSLPEGQAILFVTLSRLLGFGVELLLTVSWGALSLTGLTQGRTVVGSDG